MEIIPFAKEVDPGPCMACSLTGTRNRYDAALRLLVVECCWCHYPWFAMQPAFMQGKD